MNFDTTRLTVGKEAVLKQSSENQIKEKTAALLVRISRDDGEDGESNSIQNQKALLAKVAKDKGYADLQIFSDDGITGTTMNRPGFKAMIREIERGSIGAVFVKDLSRLGRNYREVGYYTEDFFPENDVRFVSVADGIDSAEGEDEFAPFRNIMNEWYSKDISKKRRISNKVRGSSGEPLSPPPYGYLKDPENPKRWVIDEEAAAVVRMIYDMTLNGYGLGEIIRALDKEGIVTPSYYWRSKGINRGGLKAGQSPTLWQLSTIQKTLSLQEYCGDIINFKTFSKSYRNKKRIENEAENMAVFVDVHEPIIDRATWQKVQKMRGTRKKRPKVQQQRSIFSGYLKCADCGTNLAYHFNQGNHSIKYFNCSNNNNSRGCESTHYIREDFITEVVIHEIQRLTCFANEYEDDFVKAIIGYSAKIAESERGQKQRELDRLSVRDKELDTLFGKVYEDNATGKISDDRFSKLTMMYEKEQGEISGKLKVLRNELRDGYNELYTADTFIEIVRKYTDIQELSQRMVTELIDHIDIYHIEKAGKESTQRVTIYYNCIGSFSVPDWNSIPDIDIILPTRKGVAVSYTPVQMIS